MARINQSDWPYLVRDTDKDYMQVLYNPGVPLQNSELNESQLILKGIIKGVADTILTDGDIREGVQLIVNSDNTVTLTNGKIYLEGAIHNFYEQTIPITGVGEEKIGVVIDEKAISSKEDKALVSPASGMPAYGMSGADRLEVKLLAKINDPEATTLYTLIDGKLVEEQKASEEGTFLHRLNEILARRTYDESGHYKVWGLEMSQKNQYDDKNLYVSLSEGKAYVEGYEILKNTATTIPFKRIVNTRTIKSEPKIYTSGQSLYKLNNDPVKQINSVTGEISVTTTMTRQGSVNGSDPIPSRYTPVVDIQKITDIKTSTVYKKNIDYSLEGDTVRWLSTGDSQPELGNTYSIEFTYNKEMVKGEDYNFTVQGNNYYIEILSGGDSPVQSTQMQIDYDFYLYKTNVVTLDRHGNVGVVEGQYDTIDKVATPDITNQSVLVLGYVTVAPQNDNLKIYNSKNTRSNMARIQRMYERIVDMETNIAVTDLEREAIEGAQATDLKGILTDGFLGWIKSDINHPEYNASIDPTERNLLTGYDAEVNPLTIDERNSGNYREYDRLVTASGETSKSEEQPYATNPHLINPYTIYRDVPIVEINPMVDNWIDTKRVTVQRDGGTNVERNRINKTRTVQGGFSDTGNTVSTTELTDTSTEREVDYDTTSDVVDSAIEYMRERDISITISNVLSHAVGFEVRFNDIPVEVTSLSSEFDTGHGILKANEKGIAKGTFRIPAGVRCGTVSVKACHDLFPDLIGETHYTSNGTLKTETTTTTRNTTVYITDTYTTTNTVYQKKPKPSSTSGGRTSAPSPGYKFDSKGSSTAFTGSGPSGYEGSVVKIGGKDYQYGSQSWANAWNSASASERASATSRNDKTGGVIRNVQTGEIVGNNGPYRSSSEANKTGWAKPECKTDPVAQTFEVTQSQELTHVGLYFADVDEYHPVTVQIRPVENGYPTDSYIAQKLIQPEDVLESEDGTRETVVEFDDPVYIKADTQYAIVVLSDSEFASIWIQGLGERDRVSNQVVEKNPYIDGMMFSSSNGLTWTAHQTQNLKFNLYSVEYVSEAQVQFNPIRSVDYDRIQLLADTSVPEGTSLEWEYSSDEGENWLPLKINRHVDMEKAINNVTIRANLITNGKTSPAFALDSLILVGYKNKEDSAYVSRNIQLQKEFTEVRIIADVSAPSGTGVTFYYATDINGRSWTPVSQEGDGLVKVSGDKGLVEYTYIDTLTRGAKNFRVKAELKTNNPSVQPLVRNLKCIMS